MSEFGWSGRRMVFRSVLLLFLGFVAVGVILDRVLLNIDSNSQSEWLPDRNWLAANFKLLELQLSDDTVNRYDIVVDSFAEQYSIHVELLNADDIAMPESVQARLQQGELVQLFTASGQAQYYRLLDVQRKASRSTAPVLASMTALHSDNEAHSPSWWWLSSLYYGLVLLLLVWWLLPLVRDIERLNNSASRLGGDINASTPELADVTELNELAATFAKMAAQIKAMVHGQKEMTNALSHELRTPLARVKFGIAVLQSRVDQPISEELEKINDDINEFDALIGRMLDYARLDDPALHFQPQWIAVQPWLEDLCLKSRAKDRGIQYSIVVAPNASEVFADSTLLSLAFSNLFNNALRYAKSNIAVHCAVETQGESITWSLSVADDGEGIPEAKLTEVFKAFTRLDASRDRGTGGHGLGLAVVARIAALHNGVARATQASLGGALLTVTVVYSPPA
ncbi:MAG: ATP-binding protein [Pseudomonadales bacterium]